MHTIRRLSSRRTPPGPMSDFLTLYHTDFEQIHDIGQVITREKERLLELITKTTFQEYPETEFQIYTILRKSSHIHQPLRILLHCIYLKALMLRLDNQKNETIIQFWVYIMMDLQSYPSLFLILYFDIAFRRLFARYHGIMVDDTDTIFNQLRIEPSIALELQSSTTRQAIKFIHYDVIEYLQTQKLDVNREHLFMSWLDTIQQILSRTPANLELTSIQEIIYSFQQDYKTNLYFNVNHILSYIQLLKECKQISVLDRHGSIMMMVVVAIVLLIIAMYFGFPILGLMFSSSSAILSLVFYLGASFIPRDWFGGRATSIVKSTLFVLGLFFGYSMWGVFLLEMSMIIFNMLKQSTCKASGSATGFTIGTHLDNLLCSSTLSSFSLKSVLRNDYDPLRYLKSIVQWIWTFIQKLLVSMFPTFATGSRGGSRTETTGGGNGRFSNTYSFFEKWCKRTSNQSLRNYSNSLLHDDDFMKMFKMVLDGSFLKRSSNELYRKHIDLMGSRIFILKNIGIASNNLYVRFWYHESSDAPYYPASIFTDRFEQSVDSSSFTYTKEYGVVREEDTSSSHLIRETLVDTRQSPFRPLGDSMFIERKIKKKQYDGGNNDYIRVHDLQLSSSSSSPEDFLFVYPFASIQNMRIASFKTCFLNSDPRFVVELLFLSTTEQDVVPSSSSDQALNIDEIEDLMKLGKQIPMPTPE